MVSGNTYCVWFVVLLRPFRYGGIYLYSCNFISRLRLLQDLCLQLCLSRIKLQYLSSIDHFISQSVAFPILVFDFTFCRSRSRFITLVMPLWMLSKQCRYHFVIEICLSFRLAYMYVVFASGTLRLLPCFNSVCLRLRCGRQLQGTLRFLPCFTSSCLRARCCWSRGIAFTFSQSQSVAMWASKAFISKPFSDE